MARAKGDENAQSYTDHAARLYKQIYMVDSRVDAIRLMVNWKSEYIEFDLNDTERLREFGFGIDGNGSRLPL